MNRHHQHQALNTSNLSTTSTTSGGNGGMNGERAGLVGISTSTSANLVTPKTPSSSKVKAISTPRVAKSTPVVSTITTIKKPTSSNNSSNNNTNSTSTPVVQTTNLSQQKKPSTTENKSSSINKTTINTTTPAATSTNTSSTPSTPRCSSPTIDSNVNIGRTGELINTFKNVFKQGDVNCVCYVEKTGSIWTGGSEGQFCIYDVKTNLNNLDFRRVSTNGPLNEISKLTFTSMTVVNSFSQQVDCTVWTGFSNGKIIIWDAVSINKVYEFDCHTSPVSQILTVSNTITGKRTFWTGSIDRTIRILDGDSFQAIQIITEQSPIVGMVYLEAFNQVWVLSDDGQLRIRDSIDGRIIKELPSMINSKQIIYSGQHVWTCNQEGKLRIWDCEKMKCIKEIKAHDSTIHKILATTKQVWSCGDDKVIHIFESNTLKAIKKIKANSVSVVDMIELPNQRVFAFCSDSKVRIWECEGEPLPQLLSLSNNSQQSAPLVESKNNNNSLVVVLSPVTEPQSPRIKDVAVNNATTTTTSTTNATTAQQDSTTTAIVSSSPTTPPTISIPPLKLPSSNVTFIEPATSPKLTPTTIQTTQSSTAVNAVKSLSPTKKDSPPVAADQQQLPQPTTLTPQTPPKTTTTKSQSVIPQQPKARTKFTRGVSMDLAKIIGNDHYDFLKSNIIIDKNELSLEDHDEEELNGEIEYESSSEEDEDNDSIKIMKEAYEREIVMLRRQLQETTSRIPKYKLKLKSKSERLVAKEHELGEARTLIRNLEEKEEFHKHEYDTTKQLHMEEKSKLMEHQNEVFNKLKSMYYSLSLPPSKEIEETFAQNHEQVSLVDLLDNIFVKVEVERSNQEKERYRFHQEKLENIKEKSEGVCTKLDSLKKDSMSIEEHLKQLRIENAKLYEVVADKDRTIHILNRLIEDDSFFSEDDLSETSVTMA